MNKRGQIVELIGVIVILGIAIFGASNVALQKDNLYVGNNVNLTAYKYSDCKSFINQFPQENIIIFPHIEDIPNNYHISDCK